MIRFVCSEVKLLSSFFFSRKKNITNIKRKNLYNSQFSKQDKPGLFF